MPEMTKENLPDAVKTRFEADGQLHDFIEKKNFRTAFFVKVATIYVLNDVFFLFPGPYSYIYIYMCCTYGSPIGPPAFTWFAGFEVLFAVAAVT